MGTDNLHHKKKRQKNIRKSREARKARWLIVCEGEKTEPNYFKSIRSFLDSKIDMKIDGEGKNTISLVDAAIEIKEKPDINYAKVFVVFDKDSFENRQFNDAIYKCIDSGMIPLWSNESFELWYLLHYIYTDSQISRNQYCEKLSENMGQKYAKNSKEMFDLLKPKIIYAYKNSKKLYEKSKHEKSFSNQNPNTQMFKFFDEVEEELKKFRAISFWKMIEE